MHRSRLRSPLAGPAARTGFVRAGVASISPIRPVTSLYVQPPILFLSSFAFLRVQCGYLSAGTTGNTICDGCSAS